MDVHEYKDQHGWKYRIARYAGEHQFGTRFQRPELSGETGWHEYMSLPVKPSSHEAQQDLDAYAKKCGWERWTPRGKNAENA